MTEKTKAQKAASFIEKHLVKELRIGILTGTGLGETAKILENPTIIDYSEIPHFPISTVQSHMGKLILGEIYGKRVMALQGRFHLYEGYSPEQVTGVIFQMLTGGWALSRMAQSNEHSISSLERIIEFVDQLRI